MKLDSFFNFPEMFARTDNHLDGSPMTKQIKELDINAPWWENANFPNAANHFNVSWCGTALGVIALSGGPPVLSYKTYGSIKTPLKDFMDKINALDGRLVYKTEDKEPVTMFVWPHGMLSTDFDGDSSVELTAYSNDAEFFAKVKALVKETISTTPPAGRVHVVVSTEFGPEFESMGIGGHTIERGNYTDEVLHAFDKIIADLKNPNPTGRLSIFNGPPGTGKTYLVRAVLDAATNSVCVVVPANMIQELGTPATIPALIKLRKDKGPNTPLIFLVEDADECLVTRADGNMSAISAVLNLCDGILGTLLDVRIIATTNAQRMQIDKALQRPGRLSANVEVKELPHEKALSVLQRLSGPDAVLPEGQYTLAEVYNLSRTGTTKATGIEATKERKMGFGS